jgi:hypothetical protein
MTIIAHKFCKIIIPRSEYTFSERAKAAVKFKIDDAQRVQNPLLCVCLCVFRSVAGGTRSKFEMRPGAGVFFHNSSSISVSKDAAVRAALTYFIARIYCAKIK